MRRIVIGFLALVVSIYFGCSDTDGLGDKFLLLSYNSVYAVNALSTDENITLHVGQELPETVTPYSQEPVVVEEAIGIGNIVYYLVTGGSAYGETPLEKNRTYFYAATDCSVPTATVYALAHRVETDTQITIVNTSSGPLLAADLNISVDGVQVNGSDIGACGVNAVALPSAKDQNITVSFSAGGTVSKRLPADISVDIVIYPTPPQEAAIILLPRLTPDAL